MASKKYAEVDKNRCVACGVCVKECPMQAVSVWKGCYASVAKDICIGCGKCAKSCPAGSISVVDRVEA
ncbi:MAG: 4Fe-4S binding protein [Agathobacter sp.]|nr:4Fe-4S binding protein [Agathobacter sp.]